MPFDNRLFLKQAETDRSIVVHPRARAGRQHGTNAVGEQIHLAGPLDDPPLARTVDQEIRVEDIISDQFLVERDVERRGLVLPTPFLKDPAEPLRGMRLAPKVLQFFRDRQ